MSPTHRSIVSALEKLALSAPNKPAFIFVKETLDRLVLTRQEVWDYSRKYAAMLRKVGLNNGDVVCNTLPNSPQRLISMFGAITAGCITMSAQTCMADGSDLVSSLNRGKAMAIIADACNEKGLFSTLEPRLDKYNPINHEVSCPDVPSLKQIIIHNLGNGSRFLESLDEEKQLSEEIKSDDICVFMSTSGSEGDVKLVPYNSHIFFENAMELGVKKGDTLMCDSDLGWLGGFPLSYIAFGAIRVLLDRGCHIGEHSSAALQWAVAVQEKCNVCFVPPVYLLEFAEIRKNNEMIEMQSFKFETLITGGGFITRNHVQTAFGEIALKLKILYGSTEGGLNSSKMIRSLEDYEDFIAGWPNRSTKFKIVDNHNKELPTGQIGEILTQSNHSLLHYINDPEKTLKTFDPDGWIRLGDVGKINDKGQLLVLGRNKFAISKGNIVYYPEVIERFLLECPGVKDVAIVGVPDQKLFSEICALIVKQQTVEMDETYVREFCERMFVKDDPMIPKYIFFVECFPRTHRGKLDRNTARKLACGLIGL